MQKIPARDGVEPVPGDRSGRPVAARLNELTGIPVVDDPDVLASLSHDHAQGAPHGRPAVAVRPTTTDEVAAVMRAADTLAVPVVVRGAGSGLAGGANAVDGCVVLCTDRMNRVVEVDDVERLAVVDAGVLNGDLKAVAAESGLWYPPDPASSAFCTIGGNIATNAGGLCCVRYGVTSAYVLGLTAVLADGTVLRVGGRTAKGVAGLDLTKLLVGSEGTLAVVTEAVLRVVPPAPANWMVAATFPSVEACGETVVAVRRLGLPVAMLELVDATTLRTIDRWRPTGLDAAEALLLVQLDRSATTPDEDPVVTAFRAAAADAAAVEVMVASDDAEADWLRGLRTMALPAFERLGRVMLDDVCVPLRALPRLVTGIERVAAEHDVVIGTFGHAGDGNLHPTIVEPTGGADRTAAAFAAIVGLAQRLGGTCTGEHGVGSLKLPFLAEELDPAAARLMSAVKRAFDPAGRLNPARGYA